MLPISEEGGKLSGLECPKCGALGKLSPHGGYRRYLLTEEGERIVRIKRARCLSCGSTHALLPPDIVPRKQMSRGFAEKIARAWEKGSLTIDAICRDCRIGTTTLYRTLREFAKAPRNPEGGASATASPPTNPLQHRPAIESTRAYGYPRFVANLNDPRRLSHGPTG